MERIEKIDSLITKMADPSFLKKICLLYDKKRNINYKRKRNVHIDGGNTKQPFFSETEECRKLLDFVLKKNVTTLNSKQESVCNMHKEFNSDENAKNSLQVAETLHDISNHFHKEKQKCEHIYSDFPSKSIQRTSLVSDVISPSKNLKGKGMKPDKSHFSMKREVFLKSSSNNLVTLSSNSSEDEMDLIQRSTLNKCKAITHTDKEKKSVNSSVKSKSTKVSKGSVVTIHEKEKGKCAVQNAHISPRKEFSKRKEIVFTVHSDLEEVCSNKKGKEKNGANKKKLCNTSTQQYDVSLSGISRFSPLSLPAEQDNIITITSDSSASSDVDTFEKAKGENTLKKLKVQKNKKSKISEKHPKSFVVCKPSNTFESMFCKSNSKCAWNNSVDYNLDDEVCLLDSPNLSKSDPNPAIKEHVSRKLLSVKNGVISEKYNCMNNITESSHKVCISHKNLEKFNSAESNISLISNRNHLENVANSQCVQKCLSGCPESIENVDRPLFNSKKKPYLGKFEKATLINKTKEKDISERLTNLKSTGSKVSNSTKTRSNSEYSFMNYHSDISPNISSNSNETSFELDNSSDDDVLFQGIYKPAYPCTSKGYETSENKTISQKDMSFNIKGEDLKSPEKTYKFCNNIFICDDETKKQSLIDSVEKCFGNDETQLNFSNDLQEIPIKTNSRNEIFYSNVLLSKPKEVNELTKKTFDLVPEPVDFKIPLLHESESVSFSREELERWEKQGLNVKKGRWTPQEDEILRRNFMEFSKEYEISDPVVLLGIFNGRKRDSSLLNFLKLKHFYLRLGKNLNDRPLNSIYNRARLLFHPYASNNKWGSEDVLKLMNLYEIFGSNWNEIGKVLNKSPKHCAAVFYNNTVRRNKKCTPMFEKS